MNIRSSGLEARLHAAEVFRVQWLWLVLLGTVLIVAGVVAIVVPAVVGVPANEVLGSVLIVSGGVQIMQAAKVLNHTGFSSGICCSASWPLSAVS